MSLRLWAGAFLALAAVYSLCLLAFFPGPAVNDSLMIYRNGMMMANASPVFYCVFVSVFAKLGQWLVLMVSTPVFHSIRYVLSYAYGLPVFFALLFTAGPGPAQGKAPAALPAENEQKRQGE